jgi:group I intron endonuclease
MLPTSYQNYIHLSRYARWRDDLQRRETWEETIQRYFDFFIKRIPDNENVLNKFNDVKKAVLNLEVMPSMRAVMTAGEALEKDNCAGYNCAFVAIDKPHTFDEIMYILMCFHPNTKIQTKNGPKRISEITKEDLVLSFDGEKFLYKNPDKIICNPTSKEEKLQLTFDDGSIICCTKTHKFFTKNRGEVKAIDLNETDELLENPYKFIVYKITNKINGKVYIGYTSKSIQKRFQEHINWAKSNKKLQLIHKSINKYGKENFKIEPLIICYDFDTALEKEKYYIQKYNSYFKGGFGYNMTYGGEGSFGYKWSKKQKEYAHNHAYVRTKKHKENQKNILRKNFEKINKTRQTKKYKEEQRIRNLGEKNPRYGKKHTIKWKKEMSLRNSGKNNPFYHKKHTSETINKIKETKRKNQELKNAIN